MATLINSTIPQTTITKFYMGDFVCDIILQKKIKVVTQVWMKSVKITLEYSLLFL